MWLMFFRSFALILSTKISINAAKKQRKESKNKILVKNVTAIATPPNANIPNAIAMIINKIADNNSIDVAPKLVMKKSLKNIKLITLFCIGIKS
jgi:hypothetical protein